MAMIPAVIHRKNVADLAQKIADVVSGERIEANGEELIPALQIAFRNNRPIIAIAATPIVIRGLAPLIGSKQDDPPVLAVSGNGRFIIPLLGIHHRGSRLADLVASQTGGAAVHSNATFGMASVPLDDPPPGYRLCNPQHYKGFAAQLLDGEAVNVTGDAPFLASLPQSAKAELNITVTDKAMDGSPTHLVYAAATLSVGVGCERGTSPQEVADLIAKTLGDNGLSADAVACHASIDRKEDEPAIFALLNARFFSTEELNRQQTRLVTPSETVRGIMGTPSVAEAAALAAAGEGAELIVPKAKSRRATCAIARSTAPITNPAGRPRGKLHVVGLGPGDRVFRSAEANAALWQSSDWVGYGLYLDLARDMHHQQALHNFPLGGEEERVRHAIALARQGKDVALICSGDAGIYAMASLVFEILDREPCRIAVEVIPGISAFQAAAAKAGAMIGHDFCCISLSDLLTPWDAIERRVKAAAEGDFVVAFYNPRSLKRRDQLERAMSLLGRHRPPETPVIIASNLGRPEERLDIVTLRAFDPEQVDMLTLVMVGSSQSKAMQRGDGRTYAFTPRGYAKKRETA
jgi:cobalt-precorrin 5A hydrolase/precorrin-3B C17-methyltransferase